MNTSEQISSKSASNLWLATRNLPEPKKAIFTAYYASMRVADDKVDHSIKPIENTAEDLSSWFGTLRNLYEAPENKDLQTNILLTEIADSFAKTNISITLWNRLEKALMNDVNEKDLKTWDEFYEHCKGIAIAPTEMVLYILLSNETEEGLKVEADVQIDKLAEPIGKFCYLIHIARDLVKDLTNNVKLVNIPSDTFTKYKVTKELLAKDIDNFGSRILKSELHSATIKNLVAEIINEAQKIRNQVEQASEKIAIHLRDKELSVYKGIIAQYLKIYNLLSNDTSLIINSNPLISNDERLDIIKSFY